MCGITGILSLDGGTASDTEVQDMLDMLAHRGPDGDGRYAEGPVALGHRRLAVLDTGPGGQQPMSFGDGRYWMTFNGEIYNFLELRQALEGLGHTFRSESDTEVALAAYAQWGSDCQLRFNGMWAFAIWDSEERRLFLSRDRFGVKPLLYFRGEQRFAFASEMKAFLPLPWFPGSFDPAAVAATLLRPSALEAGPDCLLEGVRRLPAGHSLAINAQGEIRVSRWWNTLEHLESVPRSFHRQVEEFKDRFSKAVQLRMRSDIPLACTLSGGLDSGSVTSTVARLRRAPAGTERQPADPPVAFVAAYPNTSRDESDLAVSVARHAEIEAVVIDIEPGELVNLLDEFVFQCEEVQSPHIGPWLLYREMRKRGFRVSLDGHGGDELLAGYIDQVRAARDSVLVPIPRPFRATHLTAILRRLQSGSGASMEMVDVLSTARAFKRLLARGGGVSPGLGQGETLSLLKVAPLKPGRQYGGTQDVGRLSPLTRRLYQDFHVQALPTILRDFDRFSMAHGVEVRSPFLDWRVVCFCLSLPPRSVLGGGFTKRILREAMKGTLPEGVRTERKKIPYKTPLNEWWTESLSEMVRDIVSSQGFLSSDVWDGKAIARLVQGANPGQRFAGALTVFRFVAAHRLMEMFKDARTSRPAVSCRRTKH